MRAKFWTAKAGSIEMSFDSKHLAFTWLNNYNDVDVASLYCLGEKKYTKIAGNIYDHSEGHTLEKLNEC